MEIKNIPAVYGLNRVLWAAIKQAGVLDEKNYNGLTPIIPIQEEPQFISAMDGQEGITSFPYIVYHWYGNTIGPDAWFNTTDMVVYKVYAIDQGALRRLVALITDLFKRYDESAGVVNAYIAKKYPVNTPDDAGVPGYEYRRYHYNSISVVASTGGSPQSAENDPHTALITIRVNYTDDRNDASLDVPPVV